MIPFAKPSFGKEEEKAAVKAIKSGWVSQGERVIEFENMVADYLGVRHCIAVTNCTSALSLVFRILGYNEGEIIIPSFTCMANVNAIYPARPAFTEIDPLTFNIDPSKIKVDMKTKAICVVHQVGLSADLDEIDRAAKQFGVPVIEDAACALGTEYKDRKVGSTGNIACFSFHPRKVITTGEGGMIATNDSYIAERARIIRSHGFGISDLERKGTITQPPCTEKGFNYRMTDIQAAIGIEQMKKIYTFLAERQEIASYYNQRIKSMDVQAPHIPSGYLPSYQSYIIKVKNRDDVIVKMSEKGISCRYGIPPLHLEPFYHKDISLPVTEEVSKQTMFLPIYPGLKEKKYIMDCLEEICG